MVQTPSRPELYRQFVDFIRSDGQKERSHASRRMKSVFFWCFILPAFVSVSILLLVKFNWLPLKARGYLDWIVLLFPVLYSIYFLSSEVLSDLPSAFRRGTLANSLSQCAAEGSWRDRVLEGMRRSVPASSADWRWVATSFRMDLEIMRQRTRFLTALAGAVFYLLMQGIDLIGDEEPQRTSWMKDSILGWISSSAAGDLNQFIGLTLFLVLLYLSGNQPYHALVRYLNCAELLALDLADSSKGK